MRFDDEAKTWDEKPERAERSILFAERLSGLIKANDYKTGMDFGAGTGVTSFRLADELEKITLIDYSSGMVDEINKKLEQKNATHMEAHCLNLLDPANALPEKYDLIYSIMTLHHILDTERLLEVFHQHLNPGGMVALVDLDSEDGSFHAKYPDFDGHLGFDRSDLFQKLKNAGFEHMVAEDFYTIFKEEDIEKSKPYPLFLIKAQKQP
ncbi:MAG: class I SAM-dependent methyltransferase [Bacteroidetes bacterium]|nr:MAG: class I SAM-dependent methyltransferase [Bacteroidota bacterium]